jgi:hypothetical protein
MSVRKPSQECPICGAVQPLSARKCSICGAVLPGELTPVAPLPSISSETEKKKRVRYDPAEGDDDLYVSDLAGPMWRLIVIGGIVLALLLGVGIGIGISRYGDNDSNGNRPGVSVETLTTGDQRPTVPPTATARGGQPSPTASQIREPLITLATVTPAPPTPTETPEPGPCLQTASAGDTVYGMAIRCGHQDMAVVDLILEMNGMDSAEELQLGQTLEIPWPTPTPGGEPVEQTDPETGNQPEGQSEAAPEVILNEFGTPDLLATYQNAEPTLRPGQAWHSVADGETILSIAVLYDTNLETLSQINPEIPFLQCDYGMDSGGPNCSVMLYVGQRVRVPVPLPTRTPTPTPVGTLTPTPTATATFNAPYLLMPEDGKQFFADERVTLRWGGTGTLAENERYVVRVRDLEAGQDYTVLATDTAYELPGGWQPVDRNRHTFEWTISVASVDGQLNIVTEDHKTEPQQFTWNSR